MQYNFYTHASCMVDVDMRGIVSGGQMANFRLEVSNWRLSFLWKTLHNFLSLLFHK